MSSLFDVKYMDLDINKGSKIETICTLAELMDDRLVNRELYVEDVKARENMSTTGIGDGIAIPHAKSKYVKVPTVAFGRSIKGIEWQSLDDTLANLVFLIAVPEGEGNEHLKILQKLAVTLMDDDFRADVIKAATKEDVLSLLNGIL